MNILSKRKLDLSRFPIEVLFFGAFAAFGLTALDGAIKKHDEMRETVASVESVGMPYSVKYEQVPVGTGMRDRSFITTNRGVFVAQGIVPYKKDRQIEIQKRKSGDAFLCYDTNECYVMESSAQ